MTPARMAGDAGEEQVAGVMLLGMAVFVAWRGVTATPGKSFAYPTRQLKAFRDAILALS